MCPIFDNEHMALVRRYRRALRVHINILQKLPPSPKRTDEMVSRDRLLMAEQWLWEKERTMLEKYFLENNILRQKLGNLIKICRANGLLMRTRNQQIPGKDSH